MNDGHHKKVVKLGTHRCAKPEETLARLRPLMSRMGITRVANVTGLDNIGIPVALACRPNSRSLAVSQGKGLSPALAQVSACMEAIELFHAEYIHLPLLLGSTDELSDGHRLVDVSRLPRLAGGRFSPDLQILWIEGYDLVRLESVWVPFESVHLNAKVPAPTGSGCFLSNSNGLASGNTILEAVMHGLCEVIERDATALWECRRRSTGLDIRVALDSIDDDDCRAVINMLAEAGNEVIVWDTTSDIGVPTFLAQIRDLENLTHRLVHSFTGMGCHCCRAVALLRALTEAAQCRLTLISGSRDDMFRREYGNQKRNEVIPILYETAVSAQTQFRSYDDTRTFEGETFLDDLRWVLKELSNAGLDSVIVVDLTKPSLGVPVVRVVVPGLEGPDDDPGYEPGYRVFEARKRLSS